MVDELYRLFRQQKWNAQKRGIVWRLTFRQWRDVWNNRLRYDRRGTGAERLRLERIDKSGIFEPGNVHLVRRLQKGELRQVAELLEALLERDGE